MPDTAAPLGGPPLVADGLPVPAGPSGEYVHPRGPSIVAPPAPPPVPAAAQPLPPPLTLPPGTRFLTPSVTIAPGPDDLPPPKKS